MTKKKGVRVCVVTTAHDAQDDRIFYKQAISLAKAGFEVSLMGHWTAEMESGPVRKVCLPPRYGKFDRIMRGPLAAFRLALREKAAVYHFHDPELLPLGLMLKLCGKRVIYDVHEDYSMKILSRRLPGLVKKAASKCLRTFEAISARRFDHVIAADSHVSSLFDPGKTTVIANYPPLDFVHDQSSPAIDADETFRVAYVGGISEIRGIGKILDALDFLGDIPVEFHLAGNVSDKALRHRLETHARTVYHGILPWQKVSKLLQKMHVGLVLFQPVPAFEYYPGENIIKLWEYLGLGLPVIISHFPKLKRLVEKLNVGIAVDPANPVKIAAAIRQLHDHRALRQKLGGNGRTIVLKEYNWENEAKKLVAIYHRVAQVPA